MAVLDLLVAASIPVLKLLFVTGIGSFLALPKINILGEDARNHLNNVVFYVYNPSLVGSNLAQTITYESLVKLWFMPVNILITFIIGSALGWVVVQLTRVPPHLRGLVIGVCAAGNMGNIFLIIIPAVCKEKVSPFGAPDVCNTYGLAYASFSLAIGAIYLWTYVYHIVRISSREISKQVETNQSSVSKPLSESSIPGIGSSTEPLLSLKDTENCADQFTLPWSRFDGKSQLSIANKIKQHAGVLLRKIDLKGVFIPSTTAAIIGFIVGLIPQIRQAIIGDTAPLRVIQSSAVLLGEGTIPSLTLILGGNLLKGLRGSGIQKSVIFGIIVARFIVMPLMGIVIVRGAIWLDFVHPDPLYQFFLYLQFALPPAMNIGTITQLFGAGETECSVIMLWTYSLASISLTLWSTLFMWMLS